MIERKFVAERIKEFQIQEFVKDNLRNVGYSHTSVQRTPLGEKIVVHASRPGLVVGRKGQNIKQLTKSLKKKFELENPQIEISEVEEINLDPYIVAEKIVNSMEMYGIQKFKGIGHKMMSDVMNAGALGIEILISGKIPSSRAKSWRFYKGYLKKCGNVAINGVKSAYATAKLKMGVVGVKVKIMPPDIELPDKINIIVEEESKEESKAEDKKEGKEPKAEDKKEGKEPKAEDKKEKKVATVEKKEEKTKEKKDESKGNKSDE